MANANHIVKRAGHTEPYDQRKLYASIYSVCLSEREPVGSAELLAGKVCEHVNEWIEGRHEVTSEDIRRIAAKHLTGYHPSAGWLYTHHRNLG